MVIIMKNNFSLGLNTNSAVKKLQEWKLKYFNDDNSVDLQFSEQYNTGSGKIEYNINSHLSVIEVGIKPASIKFPKRYMPILDSEFIKIGTTMFHEFGHYKRMIDANTPKEIQMSDLSKCYNNEYYAINHHRLPHEIDAEYTGVMSMWSALESEYPEYADKLMFEYLNDRTTEAGRAKKLYMIERPENGFQSKQQVKELFNEAYEKSLAEKREISRIFDYNGDVSRLIANDDGYGIRPEYMPVYLKLSKAETGMDVDRMMGSLVAYIHPKLHGRYPNLDFNGLEPSKVFSMQMPESTDEIRMRLGYDDGFAAAVNHITQTQDDMQQL